MIAQRLVARLPSTAVRRAAVSSRLAQPSVAPFARSFVASSMRSAGGPAPPVYQGEGGKVGEVASDEQQATGLERVELIGKMQGVDVFNMEPLNMTRAGTAQDPIKIDSMWPTRVVGCTGFPADSHDTIWLHMHRDLKNHRCPECGNVYTLNFVGEEGGDHHH